MIIDNSQNETGAPVDAVAEAVRGLAKDRNVLVREWKDTSRSWRGYDAFVIEQTKRIAAIDARIDALIATQSFPAPAAETGRGGAE